VRAPDLPKTALLTLVLFALPLLATAAVAQTPAPTADLELPAPEAAPDGDVAPNLTPEPLPQCIQITVWAQDPETGECHEFPNPCSVPDGWDRSFDPETCTNW
jgi:hypothetical protein